MKYIYILENDKKFRDEMVEAIQKVDSQVVVRWFDSLDLFAKWIKTMMLEGSASLPKGGYGLAISNEAEGTGKDHQLLLVISKNEFLGAKNIALLKRTRDLFVERGLCTRADPTSLVITSFENPDFDIKLVEDRIINNVIFKPFDKLILQQHLAFAISGRHPPSQYAIHNMKTNTRIEMLKEVDIEALSDVGFITISNREIPPGSVAKYYSPAFISLKNQKSMLASCVTCTPHPEKKDHYRCAFSYIAADSYQISSLRKLARKKDGIPFDFRWAGQGPKTPVHIAYLSPDEDARSHIKSTIEKYYSNVQVHTFAHLQHLIYSVDTEAAKKDKNFDPAFLTPVPETFHAIFTEDYHFEENYTERWSSVTETLSKFLAPPHGNPSGKIEIFLLSKKNHSDHDERKLADTVRDIFFLPMDPVYVAKKLNIFLPQLAATEVLSYPTVVHHHIAKVAHPIEISEFSEAGLVMKYYRQISIGAFREFVLWLPHQLDLPEFLAACNYTEENKTEKGVHLNHFVFFGMNDHYLKHLRRWILQNHVHSKASESA